MTKALNDQSQAMFLWLCSGSGSEDGDYGSLDLLIAKMCGIEAFKLKPAIVQVSRIHQGFKNVLKYPSALTGRDPGCDK